MSFKKGQITIFILVGIVLLVAVGFLLYYQSYSIAKSDVNSIFSFGLDVNPIQNYIENCLSITADEGLGYIGEQGGYYKLDDVPSTNSAIYNTSYYFFLGRGLMPSRSDIEGELSDYIEDYLLLCLQNFSTFKEQGWEIESGDIKSSVKLNGDNVRVLLDMPLTVKKGEQQKKVSRFIADSQNDFMRMFNTASVLVEQQMFDPDNICLSCIFDEADKNGYIIELYDLNNDTIIFSILDPESDKKLIYANKYVQYSCENLPPDLDSSFFAFCVNRRLEELGYNFYVENIPNMDATVDDLFYYKVNASGRDISFYDYSPLFDIMNETGEIYFLPKEEQIGNHTVWIKVIDNMYNEALRTFQINVVNKTI